MHRIIKFAALLLSASLLIAAGGCTGKQSITVGIAQNDSPLSFSDSDGNPDGYITELAREAGKRAGLQVNFKFIKMNDKSKNFDSGNIDAIWGEIEPNKENSKNMLFTSDYLSDSQVLIVESASKIADTNGMKGKKIGAVTGSAAELALQFSGITYAAQSYQEPVSAFLDLDGAKVDALAVDEAYARNRMAQHAEQYRMITGALATEKYAVAVRRNDSRLRDTLNAALASMKNDGTTKTISVKWFGSDMS